MYINWSYYFINLEWIYKKKVIFKPIGSIHTPTPDRSKLSGYLQHENVKIDLYSLINELIYFIVG